MLTKEDKILVKMSVGLCRRWRRTFWTLLIWLLLSK